MILIFDKIRQWECKYIHSTICILGIHLILVYHQIRQAIRDKYGIEKPSKDDDEEDYDVNEDNFSKNNNTGINTKERMSIKIIIYQK